MAVHIGGVLVDRDTIIGSGYIFDRTTYPEFSITSQAVTGNPASKSGSIEPVTFTYEDDQPFVLELAYDTKIPSWTNIYGCYVYYKVYLTLESDGNVLLNKYKIQDDSTADNLCNGGLAFGSLHTSPLYKLLSQESKKMIWETYQMYQMNKAAAAAGGSTAPTEPKFDQNYATFEIFAKNNITLTIDADWTAYAIGNLATPARTASGKFKSSIFTLS